MYSTCLNCTRDLGANDVVETLPIGRRIAFDADKGRLWVVCGSCGKWNLVPFDTRMETIDRCEQLFRDTRTRFSTDNIGMAKLTEGLTLVRVGVALRPEFASWRYGEQYKRRRRMTLGMGAAAGVTVAGAAIGLSSLAGLGVLGLAGSFYQFGQAASRMAVNRQTRIKTTHPVSGESMILSMEHLKVAGVVWQGDSPVLRLPRVLPANLYSEATWSGRSFHTVGRRVLSSLNLITGTSGAIADAVSHLAANDGDLSRWLTAEGIRQRDGDRQSEQYYDGIDQPRVLLSALPDERRLALEMWLNESVERRWLEGELTLLEREWREAEKLAKIADDLVLDDSSG